MPRVKAEKPKPEARPIANRYERLQQIAANPTIWCMALGPTYTREAVNGTTAARLVWRMANDWKDPGELFVLHHCDVEWCVNPNHLYLGDHYQNMQDRKAAGHYMSGEKHSNAKFSDQKVSEIRSAWETLREQNGGRMPYGGRAALADRFGLSVQSLKNLMSGSRKEVV